MKQGLSLLLSLGYCTLSQVIFLKPATTQVTPDGTTKTTVDVSGNDFTINQGDRVRQDYQIGFLWAEKIFASCWLCLPKN